jgi:arsenite methyltransferase
MDDPWSDWLLRRRHGGDPNYEPVIRGKVEVIRDRVLAGAKLSPGMTLVDVGSGDGVIAFGAFELVGPSLRAVLADVSASLLKHAEQRSISLGVRESCTFLQCSAEKLVGIADGSADVVTTRAVLAYVADKAAAAREFNRVLKPGGRVSIGEPIYRDEALQLASLTKHLEGRPEDAASADVRLFQRWKAAQLPSTAAEIQRNPMTNFSERDLLGLFQTSGFADLHLELHIDVRKAPPVSWETFLDVAPRPNAPTLREILSAGFNEAERGQLEKGLRPLVESGRFTERDTIAYLTAIKP